MKIITFIMGALGLVILMAWMTFPEGGGMAEISVSNPEYQHPNRHFQNLVLLYNAKENIPYWHSKYLENCDIYSKDYEKIDLCYTSFRACEARLPTETKYGFTYPDIFINPQPKDYRECLDLLKPKTWRTSMWNAIASFIGKLITGHDPGIIL